MFSHSRSIVRKAVLFALAAALSAGIGFAGDWSVGAVGAVTISPYKSYDTRVLPLPFISYKSDRLFIKGTSLGVHLLKNERHEVSLGASYLGLEFKPGKTDEAALKRLDKRRSTITADASYSLVSKIGLIRAQLSQDILGHSNGMLGSLSVHVPWMTETFVIMPGAGVQWSSSNHNDYYFGVSGREARRSGLKRYKPGDSFSPYLTLEAKYKINECWDIVAKGKAEFLPKRVKDSPMVGRSVAASIMAGVQYNF